MDEKEPTTYLDGRFSSPDAVATPWRVARSVLDEAEIFWLSTIQSDQRPHVTPLLGVWLDGSIHFCTGRDERKTKNLRLNSHCILTTGTNTLGGLDLVIEGNATEIIEESTAETSRMLSSRSNTHISRHLKELGPVSATP